MLLQNTTWLGGRCTCEIFFELGSHLAQVDAPFSLKLELLILFKLQFLICEMEAVVGCEVNADYGYAKKKIIRCWLLLLKHAGQSVMLTREHLVTNSKVLFIHYYCSGLMTFGSIPNR